MSLGAARPTALWWDGGVFLIPIQAGQCPATNTRAKTEPGHDTSASSNLPPAPAAWREGQCPVGLGVEPQGDGSQCSCPRPRAEGWQWDRAGGRELLRHDSPTPHAAAAASPAALPRCLARSRAMAAGSPAQGSATKATSSCWALLPGSAAEEPPNSPMPAAVPQGSQAAAAEQRPEGTVTAEERLHSHRRLLPKVFGTEAWLAKALGYPVSHSASPAGPRLGEAGGLGVAGGAQEWGRGG